MGRIGREGGETLPKPTERAWSRAEGLLSTERQGGGAARKWRENRTLIVAREAWEGEELGTIGRDGEWLLSFLLSTLPYRLPAVHLFSPLNTLLGILISSDVFILLPLVFHFQTHLPALTKNSASHCVDAEDTRMNTKSCP